jgi:hypothetical protein
VSYLSPEAEELLRAGRAVLQPCAADHHRILAALQLKIDGVAGPNTTGSTGGGATGIGKIALVKVIGAIVGIGIGGGGLYWAHSSDPSPVSARLAAPAVTFQETKIAEVNPPPMASDESARIGTLSEGAVPAASPSVHTVAPRSDDNLAEEVAILSRASAELHGGRPAIALDLLALHQQKYPDGLLKQERLAARVQAFCALGRTKEARAVLLQLAQLSPDSPYEAQARKACGFGATENE